MKKLIFVLCLWGISGYSFAEANCVGTIRNVYKWAQFETISMRLTLEDGSVTNYISLPTKSDESMALMAFASKAKVHIYWSAADVTKCTEGWSHNKKLEGYFVVGE